MSDYQHRLNIALASIWYRGPKPCGKALCPLVRQYLKAPKQTSSVLSGKGM